MWYDVMYCINLTSYDVMSRRVVYACRARDVCIQVNKYMHVMYACMRVIRVMYVSMWCMYVCNAMRCDALRCNECMYSSL